MHDRLRRRLDESVLVRPLGLIAAGIVAGVVTLGVDQLLPELVPTWLRFSTGTARTLLITIAGAMLTLAGITFWVRAASVQLASVQYSQRVVHGFLQDWFQQAMMGLLVGFFAYIVVVLRAVPDVTLPDGPQGETPHLGVLIAVVLAGSGVLVVLVAIRNAVRSMHAGELARRITAQTIPIIRTVHPARGADDGEVDSDLPESPGLIIRARDSGWVEEVDEAALLDPLPDGAVVGLHIRPGLFVVPGRPVCTVWVTGTRLDAPSAQELGRHVVSAVRLARLRPGGRDIHQGIAQLVDVAMGSLAQGAGDAPSAYEVVVHLELVLRELLLRDLPPVASSDDRDRRLVRLRAFTFGDYAEAAFDRLRNAAAGQPMVAAGLLDVIGSLITELEGAGLVRRAEPLRRHAALLAAAAATEATFDAELAPLRRAAARHGLDVSGVGVSSTGPISGESLD